jgi:hypothetical protein
MCGAGKKGPRQMRWCCKRAHDSRTQHLWVERERGQTEAVVQYFAPQRRSLASSECSVLTFTLQLHARRNGDEHLPIMSVAARWYAVICWCAKQYCCPHRKQQETYESVSAPRGHQRASGPGVSGTSLTWRRWHVTRSRTLRRHTGLQAMTQDLRHPTTLRSGLMQEQRAERQAAPLLSVAAALPLGKTVHGHQRQLPTQRSTLILRRTAARR